MDNKNYICPHCGESLAEYISGLMAAKGKKGGSARTEKKSAAGKRNMEKLNAAYAPEKRAAAAIKRRETMAKKKAEREQTFLFRWHRGSLAESLETIREFKSYAELLRFVQEDMFPWGIEVTSLTFEHSGIDDRIGWDTWLVSHDGHCVGMTNKNPLEL